jgi:GNAT superfamily N-acetyltransferase
MPQSSSSTVVRLATPDDVSTIFQLIKDLAEYEKLAHEVVGNISLLHDHLFGDRPYVESFIADVDGNPAGFALFFQNYSMSKGTPGYYLEDLYVQPAYRGQGLGKALLSALAQRASDKQFHHLQWSVLDWNTPAIAFYQKIGAHISDTDRIARLTGEALAQDDFRSDANDPSFSVEYVTVELISDNFGFASLLSHCSDQQYRALKSAIAAHPPGVEAVAVYANGQLAGCAIFTHSYSTFLTQPGIVVESIMVSPQHHQLDVQSILLDALAQLARERQCGRLEWLVEHDDTPAIAHCSSLGGDMKDEWRICRMDAEAILQLASQ